MRDWRSAMRGTFQELRRRRVFRVAGAYAVVGWLLLQVADATFAPLGLPAWSQRALIIAVAAGFVLACALAWVYDVTTSGIVGMTMLRVAQRRKQIGVRRALGARWRDILRYFMVENFIITTGGIVAGLLLAVGLNRLLIAYTGMPRLPIEYMAYGAGALWVLGILAVYGPASKAASISPAIATRTA